MKRYRAIAIISLLAIVATLLVAVITYKSPAQLQMESLAQFVLDNGGSTLVPVETLRYFGIPTDGANFHQLISTSEIGRLRLIQVRRRKDSGILDIFLVDLRPLTAGRFFLTSTDGQLTKAAFMDKYPEPIDGAQQRFDGEVDFWMLRVQEERKRLANSQRRRNSARRANLRLGE